MMAADPLTSRTVDDLLLADAGFDTDDDPFADKPPRSIERDDKAVLSPRKRKATNDDLFGGNLDEEVKITKPRKRIPKLDAERLLSEPGIPKIRSLLRSRDLKKKLRLKGKGHEFTDAARLLNYYQLWLDNLYPRAKFADAIQLVEKAGHTKKMQMYRKSWIDEGKPGHVRREEVDESVEEQDRSNTIDQAQKDHPETVPDQPEDEDPASMFFGADNDDTAQPHTPDDDELDALLAVGQETAPSNKLPAALDSEGEDDLDALLAESSSSKPPAQSRTDDEDDLDALLNEEQATTQEKQGEKTKSPSITSLEEGDDLDNLLGKDTHRQAAPNNIHEENFFDDDLDDLDVLLAQKDSISELELPELPHSSKPDSTKLQSMNSLPGSEEVPELDNVTSSSPVPNVQTDELDQLMDEHDATVSRKIKDTELVEEYLSSSPIPNGESQ